MNVSVNGSGGVKRFAMAVVAFVVMTAPAFAQAKPRATEPIIKGRPGDLLVIKVQATGNAAFFYDARDFPPMKSYQNDKTLVLTTLKPGLYSVNVVLWDDRRIEQVLLDVAGDVPPVPPGPTPPGPEPPGPTPIPKGASRVLIVYESADLPKMPPMQQAILFAQSIRTYLDAKCKPGPDGKTKEWRIWDKDVDVSKESAIWQGAMRAVPNVPWIRILDDSGVVVHEAILPADVPAALALLKKHFGE